VAAWIAINPESVGLSALFLFAAVAFWIAGLDIIYACQDLDVDRREGLFSIPARLGIGPALLVSRACHAAAVLALIVLGRREQLGTLYWVGLVVAALLLAAEQAVVRPNDLSRVNLAFFTLNGLVSVAFAAAAIGDILLRR
jgi:4-hydroxybenzoate polyprenyltransferase